MSEKTKDAYQQYLNRLIDEAIAEMVYREVSTWRGALAASLWADDDDDVPPWAEKPEDKP